MVGIEMPKTKIKYEEGLGGAAHIRGKSFMKATQLILKNLPQSQIDKINQLPKENFPLRQLLLPADNNKSNFELLNDYITALKDHWKKQDPSQLKLNDLAALERTLIETIQNNVYVNKKESFKKVKDELDNAENHINWKERQKKVLPLKEKDVSISREEDPVSRFTPELTKEWLKITDKQKPDWFLALPAWEQKYFLNRIQEWIDKALKTRTNLGEFLGPVPTTIRRYPGSPNAYVTTVSLNNSNPPQTLRDQGIKSVSFTKIRSGVIAPTVMKAKTKREKEEKVRITKQNLEQLVVVAIQQKIKELSEQPGFDPSKPIDLPILLQTLYSPPFQPEPRGNYNNEAVMKALDLMRQDLADPTQFLKKNKIDTKGIQFNSIDLLYSNRAVNKIRGLSMLSSLFLFDRQGKENRKTSKKLADYVKKIENPQDKALATAALESYQSMPHIRNTLNIRNLLGGKAGIAKTDNNAMAERAALEQIISGKVGIRVGSCVSGKDREEMVTEIAIAQQTFFLAYGKFPPPHNAKGADKELRDKFAEMVARQYLSGHGHELAAENSRGCDGLKNIEDVFGKDICKKIRTIGDKDYGIDPKKFDPVKSVQKVAGLNKLKVKKLNVNTETFMEKFKQSDDFNDTFKKDKESPKSKTWASNNTNKSKKEDKTRVTPLFAITETGPSLSSIVTTEKKEPLKASTEEQRGGVKHNK